MRRRALVSLLFCLLLSVAGTASAWVDLVPHDEWFGNLNPSGVVFYLAEAPSPAPEGGYQYIFDLYIRDGHYGSAVYEVLGFDPADVINIGWVGGGQGYVEDCWDDGTWDASNLWHPEAAYTSAWEIYLRGQIIGESSWPYDYTGIGLGMENYSWAWGHGEGLLLTLRVVLPDNSYTYGFPGCDLYGECDYDDDYSWYVRRYPPPSAIFGTKWEDLNGDGVRDAGEPGLLGWTIYLDENENGQLDGGEPSTTTDSNGDYSFTGLAPDTYIVAEVLETGWAQTFPGSVERVSLATDGTEGNGRSGWPSGPSISSDGRYVAFCSEATNLVSGDTNGECDVFVYDRVTDTVERVSLATDGTQGNGNSYLPSISADGRYVAFASRATNLVSGDTNYAYDIFVYDRVTDTMERVSLATDGTQGDLWSDTPSISADGRYVAFESYATNLVSGDTNAADDVFVYDRVTDTVERVSLATAGTQGDGNSYRPSISADGRYVAFYSYATDLVSGDTNGTYDIFVYDRVTDTVERVSLATDGTQGNGYSWYPSISADGRYVAFRSYATNLVSGDTNGTWDVFVYDRVADTVERVSLATDGTQGDGQSEYPSISADGRYVAFHSRATNLVSGDTNGADDVFVYDRVTNVVERLSVATDGTQGDEDSSYPSISADGRCVAFRSEASNLVPGDTNGVYDVFVAAAPAVPRAHAVEVGAGQLVTDVDFGNVRLAHIEALELFYNGNFGNAADPAKTFLAVGQASSMSRVGDDLFGNVTNYLNGITGIRVTFDTVVTFASDVSDAFSYEATPEQAENKVFSPFTPPTAATYTVDHGTGKTVVTITFADGEIKNRWLKTIIDASQVSANGFHLDGELPSPLTLPSGDGTAGGNAEFIIGNRFGDMDGNYRCLLNDAVLVRNHVSGAVVVGISNAFDVDKNGRVLLNDAVLTRNAVSGIALPALP